MSIHPKFGRLRWATAVLLSTALLMSPGRSDARGGGRGFGTGGLHGVHFAGGRRRGNDEYIKAASSEKDRLLAKLLKGICRGC